MVSDFSELFLDERPIIFRARRRALSLSEFPYDFLLLYKKLAEALAFSELGFLYENCVRLISSLPR